MKISAIIPTFNRASFLLEAIESIQKQSYRVDEIIVVDDGSTDNTQELIQALHVKYIHQTNQGVASARNTGIKAAKNKWLAFLDSDDTWCEQKIKTQVAFHEKNPKILASFTDEIWIRNDKEIQLKEHQKKENPTFLNSLRTCKIGASSFFAHKTVFEDIGYFDEEFVACEDYDLWLRILVKTPIAYIEQKLIKKYARAQNQLSFTTPFLDIYRIKALNKHKKNHYENEVTKEIEYKVSILKKGALKHHNTRILQYCEEIEKSLNLL